MSDERRRHRNVVEIANRQRQVSIAVDHYRLLLHELLIATGQAPALVGLTLVNDRQMRRLNRQHRRVDRPTDVLAFPVSSSRRKRHARIRGESASRPSAPLAHTREPICVLGDIVISVETAKRQAEGTGRTALRAECRRLLIHGYLHLLGYDHERSRREAVRMRRLERRLEGRLNRRPNSRPHTRPTIR
jgi:probable rRNA maturation factor